MMPDAPPTTLDPEDWGDLRAQGHRMLDDMFDNLAGVRERPLWQPMPDAARAARASRCRAAPARPGGRPRAVQRTSLPTRPATAIRASWAGCRAAARRSACWPRCWPAASTPTSAAATTCRSRSSARCRLDGRAVRLPAGASGIFLTGTSMANFCAVLVARDRALGRDVRARRACATRAALLAYASSEAHGCIVRAMDMAGLGSDRLRLIDVDADGRISLPPCGRRSPPTARAGLKPFLIVGTAGTVDMGAIDARCDLADIAARRRRCGSTSTAPGRRWACWRRTSRRCSQGIERADRLAFDFHKWGQVPYDAGFLLVRDARPQATPSPRRPPTCGTPSAAWRRGDGGPATSGRTCRAASAR